MTEPVPLMDLGAQHAPLMDALREASERVLASGRFILGPEVTAFEEEVAAYLGVPHAIGVSNGSDALLVALMALGIGPGDEVVTTPFSFFATAGCIVRLGARPVFVDIDPATFNLDVEQVAGAITERTKAVIPVHLFGQTVDLRALREVTNLPLVEDAAQALGAACRVGAAGTVGAFGCFSFFPTKNLGGFGDGGMLVTRDDALAEKARMLRAHGSKPKYTHHLVGGNFRLDALQAALLRVKLPHLDAWTAGRQANAAAYDAGLARSPLVTPARVHDGHAYHQYVVRAPKRDALRAHLSDAGIGTGIYYPSPLHLQPCFAELGYGAGDFPEAERACREVLALPIFPELGDARRMRVIEAIRAFPF
ncbi:MAG: DegT/DnrJ/EryC1/StrS family aminotransferase [Myxococcota bacterium]